MKPLISGVGAKRRNGHYAQEQAMPQAHYSHNEKFILTQ